LNKEIAENTKIPKKQKTDFEQKITKGAKGERGFRQGGPQRAIPSTLADSAYNLNRR
jgi:hypothetical protein